MIFCKEKGHGIEIKVGTCVLQKEHSKNTEGTSCMHFIDPSAVYTDTQTDRHTRTHYSIDLPRLRMRTEA